MKARLPGLKFVSVPLVFIGIVLLYLNFQKYQLSPANIPAESLDPTPAERQIIINFPTGSTSTQEKVYRLELINKYGRVGDFLNISPECSFDPFVLKLTIGQTYILHNKDSRPHQITIAKKVIEVPALSNIESKADFTLGPGNYATYCDGGRDAAGLIVAKSK